MLESYLSFLSDKKIKKRYVGHSSTVLDLKSTANLIRCAKTAERNPARGIKVKTLFGDARIVIAGGSALFCRR